MAVLAEGFGPWTGGPQAVGSLLTNYQNRPRTWSPQKALVEFTRLVDRTLREDGLEPADNPNPLTGLSIAVVEGDRLYTMTLGDTRLYLARDGRLAQLNGSQAEEPFTMSPVARQNAPTQVAPKLLETQLRDGDVALMCSKGVCRILDDGKLEAQLRHGGAARSIVSSARELAGAGSADDMSAIVLNIRETRASRGEKGRPLEIPASLAKGQVIDGFTLLKPFQNAERVWLATREGERFTLKFAPLEALDSEPLLHLFIKETWNATRLDGAEFFPHAFVPQSATARFYAMDFIEAPSLKTLLTSRKLATDEAIGLGRFVLRAAQFLLRFDLVHGDLKPENILMVPGYDSLQFRLVDFGSMTEVFSRTSRAGTASYLAPERFHGEAISERTEIFSLGVTLFEALTGTLPFGEIERFQTPSFHPARRPSQLNPNVPPWLESVLLRALSLDPELRYQNYSELLFDLDHPTLVVPFHTRDTPLLERDPLRFYRTGFFILLVLSLGLLLLLLKPHATGTFHS